MTTRIHPEVATALADGCHHGRRVARHCRPRGHSRVRHRWHRRPTPRRPPHRDPRRPRDPPGAGVGVANRRAPGLLHPHERTPGSAPSRHRGRRRGCFSCLSAALAEAEASGVRGAGVTPLVLGRIGAATAGRSIPANVALVANNAAVAAEIAVAFRS